MSSFSKIMEVVNRPAVVSSSEIQSPKNEEYLMVLVIKGPEGDCLVIDGTRIAGPKPWGGGQITHSFKVKKDRLLNVLPPQVNTKQELGQTS